MAGVTALLGLAACSPAAILNATISGSGLQITHDVAYGPEPRQKLDIYRPDSTAKLPVIIFFYGGSWKFGSKATYRFVAATLAQRGNVVVVPDYRLFPQVRYPTFLEDCAQATAWAGAHLENIGGNASGIFLMGHSAGAYNAVMLGLNAHYLAAAGFDRLQLAGVIGLAGPYDFKPSRDKDVHEVFASAASDAVTQPVSYVDNRTPPLLLLSGSADETVRPRNTLSLASHVQVAGGRVETKIYPNVGHIGLVLAAAPLFQWKAPAVADIEAFIAKHTTAQ